MSVECVDREYSLRHGTIPCNLSAEIKDHTTSLFRKYALLGSDVQGRRCGACRRIRVWYHFETSSAPLLDLLPRPVTGELALGVLTAWYSSPCNHFIVKQAARQQQAILSASVQTLQPVETKLVVLLHACL